MNATTQSRMAAVRLRSPGIDGLAVEQMDIPLPGDGEAVVRVHAAAITRGELDWPLDRLPAVPSYEFSGTVAALGTQTAGLAVGDAVYGLADFERDGVAREYAVLPIALLAPKPTAVGHVESAAIPLAGLSAWQGLFDHGRLVDGEHVLVTGATGGVGQFATQLARWRRARVFAAVSAPEIEQAYGLGADAVFEYAAVDELREPVDLAFDTVGGDLVRRLPAHIRPGGRLVTVAEEPPAVVKDAIEASYFIVSPNREQLSELARVVDEGAVRPLIDTVFTLDEVRQAFERVAQRGKRGKVVLQIRAEPAAISGSDAG
jgi:NADPH:quinone reductase-like Zn-dependent oxidoreductase